MSVSWDIRADQAESNIPINYSLLYFMSFWREVSITVSVKSQPNMFTNGESIETFLIHEE